MYELGFHPFLQLENIPAISTSGGKEKGKTNERRYGI
jgi:hypothetical protein